MHMRFLADPIAAEVKLILDNTLSHNTLSLNAMRSVGINTKVIGHVAEKRNQFLCSWLETLFCAHL